MDTLQLPPRPDLDQYRKRAKDLVAAARSPDANAIREWAERWLTSLARLLKVEITPFIQSSFDRAVGGIEDRVRETSSTRRGEFALSDAQFLIANAHGFATWSDFADHVDRRPRGPGEEFEAAVDAVVEGDLESLTQLLRAHPGLARARSRRAHRATLLHYTAANGVEDFRQKTPPNAVVIARALLSAGAEVDALAETYGGGTAQTTMNLLVSSTHPYDAGLQSALVDVLLDGGASIDGLDDGSRPLLTALAFGYLDAARALARRGAKVDNILAAAGLGRHDLVTRWVVDAESLVPGLSLIGPKWYSIPATPRGHIERACLWACSFGHNEIVQWLLEKGVSPAAKDGDDMTLLHHAAGHGNTALIDYLIDSGAPLEARNTWGGTVLGSTVHFAVHQPVRGVDYARVVDQLLGRGADVREVEFPTGHAMIDSMLARHMR
jgi:hypothetical protein